MSISVPDYRKIYKLQDKIISQIIHLLGNFYLTGGTALGRFYLNHRFSDDLDFFLNNDNEFGKKAREIFLFMKKHFMIDDSKSLMAEDYIRFVVVDKVTMKVEFVNDIAHRCGETCITQNKIPVDNICNILTTIFR